jgi:hypothetical protein
MRTSKYTTVQFVAAGLTLMITTNVGALMLASLTTDLRIEMPVITTPTVTTTTTTTSGTSERESNSGNSGNSGSDKKDNGNGNSGKREGAASSFMIQTATSSAAAAMFPFTTPSTPTSLFSPFSSAAAQTNSSAAASDSELSNALKDGSKCVVQRFECAIGAGALCLKRLRSRVVSCNESACAAGGCISATEFFLTRIFQRWDLGMLPGPFPRAETMCMLSRSDCADGDSSCLSDVSVEQVSCDNKDCVGDACKRVLVLVDERDSIVGASSPNIVPSGEKDKNGGKNNEGKNNDEEIVWEGNENNGNDIFGSEGHGSAEDKVKEVMQKIERGCFAPDGGWTTDRSGCDPDQTKFLNLGNPVRNESPLPASPAQGPSIQQAFNDNPEEKEARKEIEKQFFPNEKRLEQVGELREQVQTAIGRMNQLINSGLLPSEAKIRLQGTVSLLQQQQDDGTMESLQSLDEIREEAEVVKEQLGDTQVVIAQSLAQAGVYVERKPETLITKMDRVMNAIPRAISLLLQNQLKVNEQFIASFVSAQKAYEILRPRCLENTDQCLQLSEVVSMVEPVVGNMREALQLSGRTDLETQIDLMFQKQ